MDELKTAKQVSIVAWPSPQDYNEAVQTPSLSFQDPELAGSSAEVDGFGIPRPNTGMFASVYQMRSPAKSWALRCFLHFFPDQVERYAAIRDALSEHKLASTLNFDLQEEGALLKGQRYPILKMEWCDGVTLDRWVAANLENVDALEKFQADFVRVLLELKKCGIAHGDLQHGNIMLSNGEIKLVDYDGMYVPALKGRLSHELGHRDYQHPKRTQDHFDATLDNFSAWVIFLSVEILKHDPDLWKLLHGGDDCLLFRKEDFARPRRSKTFYALETHANEEIRKAARMLRYIISRPLDDMPGLDSPPRVPDDLPPLLVSAPWYKNEAGETVQDVTQFDDDSEPEELELRAVDQGPISRTGKRPRSKTKSGFQWNPGSVGKVDTPPEKPPIVLSPLAKLVRQVRSKIPAEVPAAAPSQDPSTGLSLSNETIEEVLTPKEIFVLNIFKNFILMMGVGAFMVIGILTLILVIAIFFGGGGLMLIRPLVR